MIALYPTNQVEALHVEIIQTAAQCGYLRGRVDRLEHEVNLIEGGLLVLLGLVVAAAAACLFSGVRRISAAPQQSQESTKINKDNS